MIRLAGPGDAPAIAAVHVAAWQATYRGLVPDRVMAQLSVGARAVQWRERLAQPDLAAFVAEPEGGVAGFGSCGRQRAESLAADGEVYALYLLPHAQRRGLGRSLMGAMAAALTTRGCRSVSLWVADGNLPARRFYEALGGRPINAKIEQRDGYALAETAYGWDSLPGLAAACRLASPR